MKIMIIMISVVVYFIGMFITKIIITVYDNSVSGLNSIDDFDVVAMFIWPIILPLIGLSVLFNKLYDIAEDIGDQISIKLRYRRMGLKKPKKRRGKDNE
jgi:hypothetical protein